MIFLCAFLISYLAFKTVVPMKTVGFRRQNASNTSNPACTLFVERPVTRRCTPTNRQHVEGI
jgi:hypothetical protein